MHTFPAEVEHDEALTLFQLSYYKWVSFPKSIRRQAFLNFCAFCQWLYCLQWSQAVAEMLSSVPNSKKAVVYFM